MRNLRALLWAEVILTKRNLMFLILSIGLPLFFYILFSGINAGNLNNQGQTLLLFGMTLSSVISFNVFSLPFMLNTDKHNNWMKYLQHSPVSMLQYYIAKAVRLAFYYLATMIIIFSLGVLLRGVTLTLNEWFLAAMLIVLGMIPFALLGTLISLAPSEEVISTIGNLAYMALSLLGGLWMPLFLFPSWLQTVGKVLPSYHLLHILQERLYNNTWAWDSIGILALYTVVFAFLIQLINRRVEVK